MNQHVENQRRRCRALFEAQERRKAFPSQELPLATKCVVTSDLLQMSARFDHVSLQSLDELNYNVMCMEAFGAASSSSLPQGSSPYHFIFDDDESHLEGESQAALQVPTEYRVLAVASRNKRAVAVLRKALKDVQEQVNLHIESQYDLMKSEKKKEPKPFIAGGHHHDDDETDRCLS